MDEQNIHHRDTEVTEKNGTGFEDPNGGPGEISIVRPVMDRLIPLLEAEPVLALQLCEALEAGRWLVTIHRKVKDTPPNDLESSSTHKNFTLCDVVDAMQGQCRQIVRDEAKRVEWMGRAAEDRTRWK
jgi:hypothetical protein